MKKLYYSACSTAVPHIGVLVNAIKNDIQNGHDVYFAYCRGICTSCYKNANANPSLCALCKIMYDKQILGLLDGVKKIIPLTKSYNKNNIFEYENISDLKQLQYKDVYIGISVLSHYFTKTRNVDFEINNKIRSYFDYILREQVGLVENADIIVNEIHPDCICIYNGRYYENRVFYDLSNKYKLHFESYEVLGGFGEPYYAVKYPDCLPHDIHYFAKDAIDIWNRSKKTEQEKILEAKSLYEKRKVGINVSDIMSYTSSQIKGKLPEMKEGKKNVVIYNSSSDEIAAIGGEWDDDQLFPTQYEAIRYILTVLSSDYHAYLRIHPNLAGVNYKHHLELYKLEKEFDNITIIPPESNVSSYALLDIAEKVVVLCSSMGVEACYWGKPAILIGPAFYAEMDVTYMPKSIDEIAPLLNSDLAPKNIKGALYYAFYIMNREDRAEAVIDGMDLTPEEHQICGKVYSYVSYLKLYGSHFIYKVFEELFSNVFSKVVKDKNTFVRL